MKKRHKPILFDALKQEQPTKSNSSPSRRRVAFYNFAFSALSGVGRILASVFVTVVGSLILTAFVTSITTGQPVQEVLQNYWDAAISLFKGGMK